MQIVDAPQDQQDVLKVRGEVDLRYAPCFRAILQGKLKAEIPLLILDCSELEFINSAGMAALIEYARDAQEFGGRLALAALGEHLRTIFEIVHLQEHLPAFSSVEEARAYAAELPLPCFS